MESHNYGPEAFEGALVCVLLRAPGDAHLHAKVHGQLGRLD
jgi:hypothetical protein